MSLFATLPDLSHRRRIMEVMRWDPWEHADRTRADVYPMWRAPIPGMYFPDRDAIVIDSSLPPSIQSSALAEELSHRDLGHWPHPSDVETSRMEQRARKLAAVRMVTLEDLAAALIGANSWFEVADHLQVDPDLLLFRVRGLTDEERELVLRLVGGQETPL